MEPVVEVEGLVKRYGTTPAVDGLSFKVERGSITAVLGPNGAGKTTTVECCEGYRRPDAGSVRVLGRDPLRQGADLRPRIGVMLQNGGIYSGVRADEMLRHMARLYAHPLDVPMLIERLGLGSAGRTPYRRLSGGQQQRLSLAMAMVGRPELVFLDEPTAGLDPQARRAAWELLEEMRRDGVTVVLTTHLMDEAERLSDRVVIIDHGRVVTTGTPAELTAGSARVVCFNGPSGLDRAALSAALPSPVRVEEDGRGRYTIEGDIGPELLAALTAWCVEQGVMPEGLQVGRRTLEEVFLELTGRWLRE